jgi:hypothetical protein
MCTDKGVVYSYIELNIDTSSEKQHYNGESCLEIWGESTLMIIGTK